MSKAKKSIKKAFKSVVKKTHHTAEKVVENAHKKESEIRKHLESLRGQRRDAAQILEEINENHSDEEIKELIRSKNFGTLLGEIS